MPEKKGVSPALPHAVDPRHVALVLHGAGLEKGCPVGLACLGPGGYDEDQVAVGGCAAEQLWKPEVVADEAGGPDAVHVEGGRKPPGAVMAVLVEQAYQVDLVVQGCIAPIGVDAQGGVLRRFVLAGSSGIIDSGAMSRDG